MMTLLFIFFNSYSHAQSAGKDKLLEIQCQSLANPLFVYEFRSNIFCIDGKKIHVIGILIPFYDGDDLVNFGLIDNKEFAALPKYYLGAKSIQLLFPSLNELSENIDKSCINEYADVTGHATVFSGLPAIRVEMIKATIDNRHILCYGL